MTARHVVAAAFLFDSHLAKWTRLCRPSNFLHILLGILVHFSGLVIRLTCETFMPKSLMIEADLGLTFAAADER